MSSPALAGPLAPSLKYLLGLLATILAFNFVDRIALGLVLQNIKVEFGVSDTQLGLLTGLAFAVFYSVMGIPIARWADRGNRVVIMSLSLALWGIGVVLCGLARNFTELLLLRICVAVGEAGCIPIAHSLIAAHFDRAERPRATGVFLLGGPLSVFFGYFVAGWMNELHGWRAMFVILGFASLLLAPITFFTLRDPRSARRGEEDAARQAALVPGPTLKEVCATLWANATFRNLLFAYSFMSFFANGIGKWQATFFIRSYGMTSAELGTWLSMVFGCGGLIGLYFGGRLASRYAARDETLQLKAMAVMLAGIALIDALIYLSPSRYAAFALLCMAAVGGAMTSAPMFAMIQSLVPERMRALSIALIMFIAHLIGMGLGPLAAGVLSDALRPLVGEESLRYSLVAFCPGYIWVAWHLLRASRTVKRDLEAVT